MQLSFEDKGHKYTTRNMKSRGTTSNLKISPPADFYFKKEVVLASHSPSCHPWRVFGNQERERKRREKRENKAKQENKTLFTKAVNENLQNRSPKACQTNYLYYKTRGAYIGNLKV